MIGAAIFLLVFVVWPLCAARRARRRAEARELALQEQARQMQVWREQTIANGILRAEAIKGEILAQAVARQEPPPASTRRSYYAERIAKREQDGENDFNRLLNQ